MNARRVVAVALVSLGAYACATSSSDPAPTAPAGTTPPGGTTPAPGGGTPSPTGGSTTPPPVTQNVGAAGGTISATGIVMTIPAGALPSETPITITPGDGAVPAGYAGLSPLFTFAPDGTQFHQPVTVAFALSDPGTTPTVYWSNASGGYDELPTTVTATGASASISHFSHGFVGEKKKDAADAGSDAGTTADSGGAPDGGGAADGGDAGSSGITVAVDGVATTFSANPSVTVGAATTIRADDNATATHWTLQIVMTGIPQEACQPNGNPTMTYTHYTGGILDAQYSSKTSQGACILLLSKNPTNPGDHATGSIISATLGEVSGPTTPATHGFASGSFDLVYTPPAP